MRYCGRFIRKSSSSSVPDTVCVLALVPSHVSLKQPMEQTVSECPLAQS